MKTPIERAEHEEFAKRLEAWNTRQDKRLSELEDAVRLLEAQTAAIEKLAINMEHMAKEQKDQGERLKTLESRDGEMWRTVCSYAITAVIGALLGQFFTRLH